MNPSQTSALSCFVLCIMPMLLGIGAFMAMRRLAARRPVMTIDKFRQDGMRRTIIAMDVVDNRHARPALEELPEDDRHE